MLKGKTPTEIYGIKMTGYSTHNSPTISLELWLAARDWCSSNKVAVSKLLINKPKSDNV